jgi:exopolysaccharide biosynthesis protein
VQVYPGPDDLDSTDAFPGKKVAPFAAAAHVNLAFNASPFDTPAGPFSRKRHTVGLLVQGGRLLSPPVARYAALVFCGDGRFAVLQSQTDAMPTDAIHAIGGFFPILRDGDVVAPPSARRDARLAAGVSSDGGTLYLLIGEGSDWGGGRGFTHRDCAMLLRDAGAMDALALDGGSSVCVVTGGRALPNGFEPRSVGVIVGVRVLHAASMGGLRAPPSPPAPGQPGLIPFYSHSPNNGWGEWE